MENLKALIYKGDLTSYQRALAQREFEGLIERLELYENAVKNNAVLPHVSIMLPIKAKHKLFGDVDIIGIRTECSSNNNKMYMVKNDGEYFWVYDYETELIGN